MNETVEPIARVNKPGASMTLSEIHDEMVTAERKLLEIRTAMIEQEITWWPSRLRTIAISLKTIHNAYHGEII